MTVCRLLWPSYRSGPQESGAQVRLLRLAKLTFDPILRAGYRAPQPLEPALYDAQQDIAWAEHLVFVYPI